MWIIITLIVIAALLAALGFAMAGFMTSIKGQTLDEARQWQSERYDISWYDEMEKLDYEVAGEDGYILHTQVLVNPVPTDKYVILSHGYTDNRIGSLKYARLYLALGFNCVVYDLRGHGLNAPTFCTYSLRERKDLLAQIKDARARFPDAAVLGIHGESLGAATSVGVLEYQPEIDFVVADCGFAEIEPILRAGIARSHMPDFLYALTRLCAKLRFGYDFADMRPIDALNGNAIPILFIHGENDNFIPCEHSRRMHAANPAPGALYIVPNARHAQSVFEDTEGYQAHLEAFLDELGIADEKSAS